MPTGAQRNAIERRIAELDAGDAPGPDAHLRKTIATLLTRYAPTGSAEVVSQVKANCYLEVLSDLPAWTVREARLRWARGECGAQNYAFAPSESELRRIALDVWKVSKGERVGLRRILAAQEEPPPMTEDERERCLVAAEIAKAELAKVGVKLGEAA